MEQTRQAAGEKAVLAGLDAACFTKEETASEVSLTELQALLETAGGECVGKVLQSRPTPDPHSFVGQGKAEEIRDLVKETGAKLVIFDNDLTPSQIKALEGLTGASVLDRSALILDIFAQRAKTREGKLQVELAQYQYILPRLAGLGKSMSRLGGGIGTRGPGETQLEVDRRRIRRRITELERSLSELSSRRALRRDRREKTGESVVALVGYTNAGKSTLLNALSGSDVLVEDKLFATLDPVMRKIDLPENRSCLLVDTVGFIRKLPHQLVEAFKSTLEEALCADLIVIVSDASSEHCAEQRSVVLDVLSQLGAAGKPMIEALNKCDRLDETPLHTPDLIPISASSGAGLDELRAAIARRIGALRQHVKVNVPYAEGAVLSLIHDGGQVVHEEYTADGTVVECYLDAALCQRVEKMLKGGGVEAVGSAN